LTSLSPYRAKKHWQSSSRPTARTQGAASLRDYRRGSPIRRFTEQQAKAMENELQSQGIKAQCFGGDAILASFTSRGD